MKTLSDKNNKHGIFGPNYYSEDDVKQFIEDLKDSISPSWRFKKEDIEEKIDELAGEKLL